MSYAKLSDIENRITRTLSADEENVAVNLLDDAAVIIDAYNAKASDAAKLTVSCRMVIRALGDGEISGIPLGASQGSMSGLSYAQSWTLGSGGSVGELYLSKQDKDILGRANSIGSYSPVQGMTGVDYAVMFEGMVSS